METKRSTGIVPKDVELIRKISEDRSELPPWLFKHQDLEEALEDAQTIDQKDLTNICNHIHFTDGYLYVHLRHPRYEEGILLKACPEPCLGVELTCRWYQKSSSVLLLDNYRFLHLLIDDGRSLILVPATMKSMDNESFTVQLPNKSYSVGQRQAKRYPCHGVIAELMQNGFQARGELLDFNQVGFRINVSPDPNSSFRWLNSDELVQIHLRRDQRIIFSGACKYLRKGRPQHDKEIVLASVNKGIKRFKKKRARNLRQRLVPSPSLHFEHPLLKKKVQLEVYDISTSGFCVYEAEDMKVLMPGMIIPELTISFSGALKIECAAQVIYRLDDDERGGRYGLAILDMDINAYSRLTQILTNTLEPHAYVSSEVDMEALWEFFFETGFIYPKKYRLIQSKRDIFKETYRKLYQENPEIAKHFTYQKSGRIYGHISMIRAYERAWMMHHHAARAAESRRTGFIVLKQLMHYLNDLHRLPSSKMDYAISYFRPENKFPDRVFGGFARGLNNPRGCSMDLFAYLSHTSLSLGAQLPEMWSLKRSSALDIWDFKRFYEQSSGGLLLDALGLEQKNDHDESLENVYGRLGFLRKWRAYSLVNKGELNALLIVNQSDLGINLSDLLSGIKVLVTNPDELPWNILSIAISKLTGEYNMNRVPVLFYPFKYVLDNEIPYEKQYQMWILNVEYGNEYMEYMRKRFRVGYK
ncbi:MAG: PilZ domain-containing protein [Deltaproteobacteria bacterium]|nr:PilZ domain-containing protein [Deltaproteobacteria bacterium]